MNGIKSTILVIDDERQIRKFLRITLSASGYKVEEAEKGEVGMRMATSIKPDLIICDLGLPDIDGTEVIHQIRENSSVPIIVLSVRSDNEDIVQALDLGADDYLVKPFDSEILLARIRANLRKGVKAEGGAPIMQVGDIIMDTIRHEVKIKDEKINLSPKEYKLLRYFMFNAGKMIMHSQLLTELWGKAHEENIQYLRIYIGQLRQKIEPTPSSPTYIITEAGIGYRMEKM
jgi:two-component system KDP operon response regulator KdpE